MQRSRQRWNRMKESSQPLGFNGNATWSRPAGPARPPGDMLGRGKGEKREKEIKSSATAAEDNSTQQIGWIRKVKERKTARTVLAF